MSWLRSSFKIPLQAIVILSLVCLVGAIWIAALTPKPGVYELSLYDNYSNVFWVLTIAASILSMLVLLAASMGQAQPRLGSLSLLTLIGVNVFLVSLPLFLGYAANNRADALNHIGYVRDILNTERISRLDFYPGMHFLQFAVETIGGVTSAQALVIANLFFIILWTLGPVMLVYRLSGDIKSAYLAAAFTAPLWLLYYHVYVLPSVLSVSLIPVLLALHWCRKVGSGLNRWAVVISEIVIAFFLVYLHPATTLFFIALLVSFEASSVIYQWIERRRSKSPREIDLVPFLGMAAILFVTFFAWYFSFSIFTGYFANTIEWLLGEQDRSSAMGEAFGLIQIAQLDLRDLAKIIINAFAAPVVIVALTGVMAIIFLVTHLRNRRNLPYLHYVHILSFFALCVFVIAMFLISTSERHPIRLLRLLVTMGVCVSAWWLWEAIFNPTASSHWPAIFRSKKKLFLGISGVFLGVGVVLTQLNLYEHPRNGLPNQRVTFSEMSGMEWFIRHRPSETRTAAILPDYVTRFDTYFWGYRGVRDARSNWWEKEIWLPSRFYEKEWKCISNISPDSTAYLILSENGRVAALRFPESVRDRAHVYEPKDWQRLATDKSANKIYDNGAFQVWMTNPKSTNCE